MRKRLPVDEGASAVAFRAAILVVESHVNIGSVEEISVAAIARLICRVDGPGGDNVFDPAKPGGLPVISADVSKLRAPGWSRARGLEQGVRKVWGFRQIGIRLNGVGQTAGWLCAFLSVDDRAEVSELRTHGGILVQAAEP